MKREVEWEVGRREVGREVGKKRKESNWELRMKVISDVEDKCKEKCEGRDIGSKKRSEMGSGKESRMRSAMGV
jgi:hypothetical protein